MIPGPVKGHVPIDPGAAKRPPSEPAGEAGADSGTSFADLLAAMLSPGAGGQIEAPVPTGAEAVFDRLDAAEMFNEAGLFRGAAPLLSDEAVAAAASAAASEASPGAGPEADLQAALSPGLDATSSAPIDAAGASGRAAANSGGTRIPGTAAGTPKIVHDAASPSPDGATAASTGTSARGAAAPAAAGGGGRVSPRTVAMVTQLMLARAGAASQVSVQVAEGGVSVMARVDKLSREERDRLRIEIGELLDRHGFAGAEIILNGEAWPLPKGEEN